MYLEDKRELSSSHNHEDNDENNNTQLLRTISLVSHNHQPHKATKAVISIDQNTDVAGTALLNQASAGALVHRTTTTRESTILGGVDEGVNNNSTSTNSRRRSTHASENGTCTDRFYREKYHQNRISL